LEWIKYFVCALNKNNCYACTADRLETQVVLFLLGWTLNPYSMACMIALYQEDLTWRNVSWKTLLLLIPVVKGPKQKHP
jgi:hypothetical protein